MGFDLSPLTTHINKNAFTTSSGLRRVLQRSTFFLLATLTPLILFTHLLDSHYYVNTAGKYLHPLFLILWSDPVGRSVGSLEINSRDDGDGHGWLACVGSSEN